MWKRAALMHIYRMNVSASVSAKLITVVKMLWITPGDPLASPALVPNPQGGPWQMGLECETKLHLTVCSEFPGLGGEDLSRPLSGGTQRSTNISNQREYK